ncbi:aldehyde dehydrogenase family protein [Candidatus Acidulodesulfobacterium sp. H_13]|uniref:aldehyde dehydrogenase family protein n=1 Tax=Candidatus Acidulodesulfobacterium sp. H_13 TaxID=3395470 RepID=UPI003AF6F671
MPKNYPLYINGKWIEKKDFYEVINPFNDNVIGFLSKPDENDIKSAVASAEKGFLKMKDLHTYERFEILEKTGEILKKNSKELARFISLEAGKAYKYSLIETQRVVDLFKYAAEEAKRIHGETVPMDIIKGFENRIAFYLRVPVGVIAAITPFNFPANLPAHKIAPAIAAGNSIVFKPSVNGSITAYFLVQALLEAGLPKDAINLLYGDEDTGESLVSNEKVRMISFTGSPKVGKKIMSKGGLKKYAMELGSNSALIIDKSADIVEAARKAVIGAFYNSGQVCISLQRIYIHQDVEKEFIGYFIKETKKLKIGDPINEETDIGPLINPESKHRITAWVDEAVKEGAKVELGGDFNGNIMEPTIFSNVKQDMKISCLEIFAPVVSLVAFKHISEAVHYVNDSIYGLQAGIYTNDFKNALYCIKRIDTGGVLINDIPTTRADHQPYGGVKESGIGREGIKYAVEEMTELKFISFG